MRLLSSLSAVIITLFLAGCDGESSDPGPNGTDLTEPLDSTTDVGPEPVAYPEGPFGVAKGETMANLSFLDPSSGDQLALAQWYQHPKVKLLMLVSTAGW